MTLFWLIPAAALGVGVLVAAVAAARAAEEATRLRHEAARLGDFRPAVVRIGDDAQVLRDRLRTLRAR